MCVKALRKIQDHLGKVLDEPDGVDPDQLKLIATRLRAQAEEMELGL